MVSPYGHDQATHGRQHPEREQYPAELSTQHQCQKKRDHRGCDGKGGTQIREPRRPGLEGLDVHTAGCTRVYRNNQHQAAGCASPGWKIGGMPSVLSSENTDLGTCQPADRG